MDNKETLQGYNTNLSGNNDTLATILQTINDLPEYVEPVEPEDLTEELNTYTTEVEEQEVTLKDIVDAIENKVGYAEDLSDELTTQDEKITTQNTTVDDIIRVLNEKVLFGGEEMVKYSLGEREIGTWIDGKPVYRKVVNVGQLSQQNNNSYNHNIENLGQIIDAKAMGYDGTQYYPIPFAAVSSMYDNKNVGLRVDATNVYIGVGATTSFTSHTAIVVLEYTKTTD